MFESAMTEALTVHLIEPLPNSSALSDAHFEAIYDSRLVGWEDMIVGSYLLIVCILAFTLNALVIYTCFRNWKALIVSDLYILNLACSDVLLPVSAFPLPIFSSFFHRWIFGEIGCVIYGFLGFFFGLVSITTLTIMGFTRYISICHPHIDICGKRSFFKSSIIMPYIYALIWSSLPLIGWGSYSLESYGTSCTLQWNGNKVFITLMSLFCIFTPSVIIVVSYGLILLKCRRSNRNIRGWRTRNEKMSRKESFLIKITFAMCWGFLISWMPYAVVSMWTAYGDTSVLPIRLTAVAVLMAKSSTVVNPCIYFLMSKKFRPLLFRSLNIPCFKIRTLQRSSTKRSWNFISLVLAYKTNTASVSANVTNESSFSNPQAATCTKYVVKALNNDIANGSDVQL